MAERVLDPERDRWFLGTLDRIAATANDTSGGYGVLIRIASRGFAPPIHQHSREDTGFLVLDGALRLLIGDAERMLGPNEFAFAPRGVPHWFRVESETARFIEIVTPGGFEGFHLAISQPAERFEIPPAELPVPTLEEVKQASAAFGTTVFGPRK